MSDLERIKGNIGKMIEAGAPQGDIDKYLGMEGVSLEELQGGPAVTNRFLVEAGQGLQKAGDAMNQAREGMMTFLSNPKENILRPTLDALPGAGAMIGGAVPYIATGGTAGAAGPLPGVAGAALGGATGEALKQAGERMFFTNESAPISKQIAGVGLAAKDAAIGQMTGELGNVAITKALAPLASGMTAAGKRALEWSQKNDVPLSPDQIRPGWFNKMVVGTADATPGGSYFAQKQRAKTAERLLDMRNSVISDVLDLPKPGQGFALKEAKNAAYGELDAPVLQYAAEKHIAPAFEMPNTLKFLETEGQGLSGSKKLKDAVMKFRANYGEALNAEIAAAKQSPDVLLTPEVVDEIKQQALAKVKFPWEDVKNLRSSLWGNSAGPEKFGKLAPEQVNLRSGLRDAIEADYAAIGQKVDADLPALAEAAKAKYLDYKSATKADFIENLLNQATQVNEQDGSMLFLPMKFKQVLQKNATKLEKEFQYDQPTLTMLKNWASDMEIAGVDLGRFMKRDQAGAAGTLADMAKFSVPQGLAMGAKAIGGSALLPVAVPVFAGFESAVAYKMMKPDGAMKRWLTEGIQQSPSFKLMQTQGTAGLLTEMNSRDREMRSK